MATEKIPLVSVIIPMYNSAKFIPQTLESLLYQTMKDFEVVVVDDYSTDNSVEVVEGFKMRFDSLGVKLHVIKLPKNTGKPGLPRNVGIQFARGKYISFLDSDDLYTKTALEELSTLAEKYQADVVRMYNRYVLWKGQKRSVDDLTFVDTKELLNPTNWSVISEGNKEYLTAPLLLSDDMTEKLKNFFNWHYFWSSLLAFYRRDFLLTKQIFFSSMILSEDAPFVFECFISAKKYLIVPNTTYIVRPRLDSISSSNNQNINIVNYLHKNISSLHDGLNELERIMNNFPFFNNRPDYRYALLDFFCQRSFLFMMPIQQSIYSQVPIFQLNELVKKEFQSDDAAFSAYLFNTVNIQRLQIMRLQQELAKFQKQ
ncbi:MAG: glycosyltransferase family 2 protein [Selenomonadaceae bacterium]|nr:glycosyltransferase family 2 protein [Selenomonadaceae bacterium]